MSIHTQLAHWVLTYIGQKSSLSSSAVISGIGSGGNFQGSDRNNLAQLSSFLQACLQRIGSKLNSAPGRTKADKT